MITPDELEILRKPEVQAKFREAKWEIGDRVFHPANKEGTVVEIHASYGTLWITIWFESKTENLSYASDSKMLIRLPLPIDPDNPERGLTGQINRFERLQKVTDNIWVCWVWDEWYHGLIEFNGDAPRLALLKALEWQIGRTRGV